MFWFVLDFFCLTFVGSLVLLLLFSMLWSGVNVNSVVYSAGSGRLGFGDLVSDLIV